MLFWGHTYAYWKEKLFGTMLSILSFFILIIWVKPEYATYKELIKEFPTIGMCVFGFLLTFLGIILQGDSPTIEWMKNNEKLYPSFIKKNKSVVVFSLILSIYSYFLGYLHFSENSFSFFGKSFTLFVVNNLSTIKIVMVSAFISMLIKYIYDTWVFIKIFYLLIKKN